MSTTLERVNDPTEFGGLIAEEAERLDRLYPGWANRVNLAKLNLWSGDDCVLGQVTGDFVGAYETVRMDGYSATNAYSDHELFANDWAAEITKRQNA